jgi:hypothetical protein
MRPVTLHQGSIGASRKIGGDVTLERHNPFISPCEVQADGLRDDYLHAPAPKTTKLGPTF